jgi:hypothetical protein
VRAAPTKAGDAASVKFLETDHGRILTVFPPPWPEIAGFTPGQRGSYMVDLTFEQAKQCFNDIREWYSGSAKSANKLYMPPASPEKIERRRTGASYARNAMLSLRNTDRPAVDYGLHILSHGFKFGNCWEMTCVAAAHVDAHYPGARMQVCSLDDPGDHVFLHLGVPLNDGETMQSLFSVFVEHSYVIDIWSGIVCHVSDYALDFTNKMKKWEANNKHIGLPTYGLVMPTGGYLDDALSSEIESHDPYVERN